MNEPIHKTQDAAIAWVRDNTENTLFIDWTRHEVVRIDGENVMILKESDGFFWESLKEAK